MKWGGKQFVENKENKQGYKKARDGVGGYHFCSVFWINSKL